MFLSPSFVYKKADEMNPESWAHNALFSESQTDKT